MLELEINGKLIKEDQPLADVGILVTPAINEDYWLMRVKLSPKQAVVCFPKFFTIGIGFQVEEDWNTNLPYNCSVYKIFNHIAHNKGDDSIPDEDVRKAIEMLQEQIERLEIMKKLYN